ncbi:hypothetical protein [Photobacterium sp. BZF1]|uniref:hypothetical protein n=1 Tax=Photobacterium sp. BZF1 TaxID=1904457 RepID=UPI001CA41A94|nr:hypothetical protein [Photobacterium sp. BZF1]
MKNALIINAHQLWPSFAEGKLNQSFVSLAEKRLTALGYEVKTTTIELLMKRLKSISGQIWYYWYKRRFTG